MTQVYPGFQPPTPPTPPTQFPAQPSYPGGPAQLPPGYPQQYQQPYAPQYPTAQGYPAPQMAPPAPPLAQGSIDDFFNQPSAGGGKSLAFKAIGTRYIGIVTRAVTQGDIQQQTNTQGIPQTFKDGRPKFVMKVPLQMQPSAEHPDGLGVWFVKGQARDELVRAMAEAGAPAGPPEAGAIIDVTYVSDRQAGAGMNPAKQFHVVYARPDGQASSPAPEQVQQPAAGTAPQQPAYAPPPAQVAAPQYQQPAAPVAPAAPPSAPAAQAPVQQPAAPADLSPEQQQLLARLTNSAGS